MKLAVSALFLALFVLLQVQAAFFIIALVTKFEPLLFTRIFCLTQDQSPYFVLDMLIIGYLTVATISFCDNGKEKKIVRQHIKQDIFCLIW